MALNEQKKMWSLDVSNWPGISQKGNMAGWAIRSRYGGINVTRGFKEMWFGSAEAPDEA